MSSSFAEKGGPAPLAGPPAATGGAARAAPACWPADEEEAPAPALLRMRVSKSSFFRMPLSINSFTLSSDQEEEAIPARHGLHLGRAPGRRLGASEFFQGR